MVSTGQHLQIALNMRNLGQQITSVWHYRVVTAVGEIVTAAQVGEAWWSHVQTPWRNIAGVSLDQKFLSVVVKDAADNAGDYGVFPIGVGQQIGLRGNIASGSGGDPAPSFMAAGVQLTVATRTTRPGQKRIPFLLETDVETQYVSSAFRNLVGEIMNACSSTIVLGTPAVGVTLRCEVYVPANPTLALAERAQDVVGYIVNPNVTTQNSRKLGRGN